MNSLSGQIDFDKWNTNDAVEIVEHNSDIILKNTYLNIEIKNDLNKQLINYYSDEQNKILVFSFGKLILNIENPLKKIVELYLSKGENYLDKFGGTFILVLIDIKNEKVILSSDCVGLIGLYYIKSNSQLIFSTDISNIANSEYKINKSGLTEYLLINYAITKETIFKGIHKLQPAESISFTKNCINPVIYFDVLNHLTEIANKLNNNQKSVIETSETLKKISKDYSFENNTIVTLTSGLDSRLLLSSLMANNSNISAFTFGVNENIEFNVAEIIKEKLKIKNYYKILLGDEYPKFIKSYFEFIKKSNNINLNINRYHYVYVWSKIKELGLKGNILTGIGGNTFVRDGLSVSKQTNKLLYSLIYTSNKEETIKNFVAAKAALLSHAGLNQKDAVDYLVTIFQEIKNDNKYFNHYYIKINYGIKNYFGAELSSENFVYPTFTPFFDIRYLEDLVKSGYSIFTNKFLDDKKQFKFISHNFYAEMVKILQENLLDIVTNRGYPLRYSLYKRFFILTLLRYFINNRRKLIYDLNYNEWLSNIKLDNNQNIEFNDAVKLKCVNTIFD